MARSPAEDEHIVGSVGRSVRFFFFSFPCRYRVEKVGTVDLERTPKNIHALHIVLPNFSAEHAFGSHILYVERANILGMRSLIYF